MFSTLVEPTPGSADPSSTNIDVLHADATLGVQANLLPTSTQDPNKSSTSELTMNMDVDLSSWMTTKPALRDKAFLQEPLSGQGVKSV